MTEAPPIEATKIAQAHHPNLLERLAQSVPERGLTSLKDQDTWMGSSSLLAALQAAGSVWQGVIDVVAGAETRVFLCGQATRPSR